MVADGRGFAIDVDALRRAVTPKTRALILNSPHNPTGMVASDAELAAIAKLACDADLLVITDEVYEHLVFRSAAAICRWPTIREWPSGRSPSPARRRCSTSPAGRSDGPAVAADLIKGVRAAKQYLSYVGGAPFQPAVAQAFNTEDAWVAALRESLQAKRDRLGTALDDLGFEVHDSFGTYFLCADPRPLGYDDSTHVLRRATGEGRGCGDSDVGVLRVDRQPVESPGALRFLQARRHSRRGHPPTASATEQ